MKSWIFLRGLTREKEHWGSFKPLFEKELNAKVHCLDFPGVGEYYREHSPNTIKEIAEHVVMHSSHIHEQSWIFAHSMGCLVALELMKREPHRFHGAVFINTSVRGISPAFSRLRWLGLKSFLKIGFSQNPHKKEELKYLLSSNLPENKEKTIANWMEIQKKHPVTIPTTWNQLWAAAHYEASKPRYPVLLLNSLGDKLVHPSCSQRISDQWKLPIRTHPRAGHEIMLDDPEWIIQQIKDWFKTSS